jgi:histone H3/H4
MRVLSQILRKMVRENRVRQEGAESHQDTVNEMAVDLAWDMGEMALDLAKFRAR